MIRSAASKVMCLLQRTSSTIAFFSLAVVVAGLMGVLVEAKPAHAATFTVNSMGDAGDTNVGNGSCFTGTFVQIGPRFEPECTLRAAIQEANNNDQSDTISFGSWLSGTITLSLGQLTVANDSPVDEDLRIDGPGARVLAISGNDQTRAFRIEGSATIKGLTIRNCKVFNLDGGGIANFGTLTVANSTLSGNDANGSVGGGIANFGTLTVTNSTLSGNHADHGGGGIYNYHGTLTVTNSTLSGNSSANDGGGIYNDGGTLTVTNSTLSGNSANSAASGYGGGIFDHLGTTTLMNTIVAGNSASAESPDVNGQVNSQGNNLIGNRSGSLGWVSSDLLDVKPLLGPLQDNGGPTNTRALLPGSPAVDAANNAACPPRDQRGVTRFDGDKNGTVVCDIGAFERNDLIAPRVTDTFPDAGQMGVKRAANLSATFSERMDRATLTKLTFKLYRINSNRTLTQVTNVTVASSTDGLKAILNPFGTSTTVLAANTRYRAIVTTAAKDLAGNRLDQNRTLSGYQPMAWTFTTGSS